MSNDPHGFRALIARFLVARRLQNYAVSGWKNINYRLKWFARWCEERGLERPDEVSRASMEAYQRWLFHYRKKDGCPLKVESQQARLAAVRSFYSWLVKQGFLHTNPASELELPKTPETLPTGILKLEEIEAVMAQPDLSTASGLRDRAIMELLFSTGMRREEAQQLQVVDLDLGDGVLWIRRGKGGSPRMVPVGRRALAWIEKYLLEARPELKGPHMDGAMFLNYRGQRLGLSSLTNRISRYVHGAGIDKRGACHLFRHSMATLMLEGGADIRHIQAILGHRKLSSTQLYTKVSIKHLKEVHARTHPSAKFKKDEA